MALVCFLVCANVEKVNTKTSAKTKINHACVVAFFELKINRSRNNYEIPHLHEKNGTFAIIRLARRHRSTLETFIIHTRKKEMKKSTKLFPSSFIDRIIQIQTNATILNVVFFNPSCYYLFA